MRIIPSRNHVMAAERMPAAYRPGNQARLEPSRASNPSLAEADAYMPEASETRSANGWGNDNGLSFRRPMVAPWQPYRRDGKWGRSRLPNLPSAQPEALTTPMTNITGAPPTQLPSAQAVPLTTPIVPADVSGLGSMLPRNIRRVLGTPMTGMHIPTIQKLYPTKASMLPRPHDPRVPYNGMTRVGTAGMGALDTPSLWLAGGCIVGLFLLMRARTSAH